MLLPVADWPDLPSNVRAAFTTRQGGFSTAPYDDGSGNGSGGFNLGLHVGDQRADVERNRASLGAQLPSEPAWLNQIHSTTVIDASAVIATAGAPPDADASISTQSGVVCLVQTADCLPVLFCDTAGSVVGAAHAGWRGLANGVLENTVLRMRESQIDKGVGEISAWLGAAIGPSCFEVGEDVFAAFVARDSSLSRAFLPLAHRPNKYLADIYTLARALLREVGVVRVAGGTQCTVTERQRFYSYRRDQITGRMASMIWIA
ncbi:MAG: peptidoglycan editing factor PgeF [Pseudomonadota bacterium]